MSLTRLSKDVAVDLKAVASARILDPTSDYTNENYGWRVTVVLANGSFYCIECGEDELSARALLDMIVSGSITTTQASASFGAITPS